MIQEENLTVKLFTLNNLQFPNLQNSNVGSVDLSSAGITALVGYEGFISIPGVSLWTAIPYVQIEFNLTFDYTTNTKLARIVASGMTAVAESCTAYVFIYYTKT